MTSTSIGATERRSIPANSAFLQRTVRKLAPQNAFETASRVSGWPKQDKHLVKFLISATKSSVFGEYLRLRNQIIPNANCIPRIDVFNRFRCCRTSVCACSIVTATNRTDWPGRICAAIPRSAVMTCPIRG